MNSRYLSAVMVFAGIAFLSVTSTAQAPQVERKLAMEDGATLMQMILATQANKPFTQKPAAPSGDVAPGMAFTRPERVPGYGLLAEVLPLIPSVAEEAKLVDYQTASYRGYTIRMTRSEDRKRFDVAIMQEGRCSLSWFSNEKNVIYSGQPLGCPTQ